RSCAPPIPVHSSRRSGPLDVSCFGPRRETRAASYSLCLPHDTRVLGTTTEEGAVEDKSLDTRTGSGPEAGQTGPPDPDARRRTERNARIAVTIFARLVIAGGGIRFVGSGSISTLASTVPWGPGVIMFFMGVTLALP